MPATSPTLSPHVVGNGGGVAGIVFRDARLDLAHQVGAHVGCLGVDAASHTGEEGLGGGTHAEGQHGGGDDAEFMAGRQRVGGNDSLQQEIPEGNVQQTQPHDHQAHHRATAEGDAQAGVERAAGGVCRAGGSIGGRLHAQKAGQAGEETAGQEGDGHPRVLHVEAVGHDGKHEGQAHKHEGHDLVLLFEVRHRPLADGGGDFHHLRGTLTFFHHLPVEIPGERQCQDRRCRHQPK